MSLFSNLYLGTSGLRISSNALNTTAHNITNVDTDGYTRQQVSLATSVYQTISKEHAIGYDQLGLGVTYAETRQVRDYFLDVNMRRESGRSEFYQTSVDALNQVEDMDFWDQFRLLYHRRIACFETSFIKDPNT